MTPAEIVDRLRMALGDRAYAYKKVFGGPLGEVVLKDLARFCFAHETTFQADERAHAVAEGRREVWLRLQNHLQLQPEQLWNLYQGARQG